MVLPAGIGCDICGELVEDERVREFEVEGVGEKLHSHHACFGHLEIAAATEAWEDLPATSPLRKWAAGCDDPWAAVRDGHQRRTLQ